MADINCPYHAVDLKIALIGVGNLLTPEVQEKIVAQLNTIGDGIEDRASLNKKAAEFHGISMEMLINSPNMSELASQYRNHLFYEAIKVLEGLGFSNKQAWACLLANQLDAVSF